MEAGYEGISVKKASDTYTALYDLEEFYVGIVRFHSFVCMDQYFVIKNHVLKCKFSPIFTSM